MHTSELSELIQQAHLGLALLQRNKSNLACCEAPEEPFVQAPPASTWSSGTSGDSVHSACHSRTYTSNRREQQERSSHCCCRRSLPQPGRRAAAAAVYGMVHESQMICAAPPHLLAMHVAKGRVASSRQLGVGGSQRQQPTPHKLAGLPGCACWSRGHACFALLGHGVLLPLLPALLHPAAQEAQRGAAWRQLAAGKGGRQLGICWRQEDCQLGGGVSIHGVALRCVVKKVFQPQSQVHLLCCL